MDAPHRTRKLARALRKQMTLPEVLLWRAIKGRKVVGLHFRKQHPLGPYVLDFYCQTARLCVEIDSAAHSAGERPLRDEFRDAWLAERGVRTLRISAELVLQDVDDAVATIRQAVEAPSVSALRPDPPPPEGEDLRGIPNAKTPPRGGRGGVSLPKRCGGRGEAPRVLS